MRVRDALAALSLSLWACKSSGQAEVPTGVALEEGRLEVTFEGQRSFGSRRLAEVIASDLEGLERRSSARAAVDDAAYSLELFYRSEGFPACQIRYRTDDSADGTVRAVLEIAEGPRVAIGDVRFRGNTAFGADDLRTFLLPRRRWRILPRPTVWFVASRVADAAEAISAYYASEGWLDARVELVAPDPLAGPWDGEARVELLVDEGLRYRLADVQLSGGVERIDATFRREVRLGEPVHPRLGSALRTRLAEHYARGGYPDARIAVIEELDPVRGSLVLSLSIDPGPLVTIGETIVEGEVTTDLDRVLAALALREGHRYDVEEQRRSFKNLYRLGVFSSVGLELERAEGGKPGQAEPDAQGQAAAPGAPPEGASEVRDLHVKLVESPSREIYVEPGYGSYERLRAVVGWRERNLFGRARSLSAEGTVSQLAQRATLDLTDPRLLDSESMGILSLFGGRREEPSYTSADVGGTTMLVRELRQSLRLALSYQYRYSGVQAQDLDDPEVQELLDDVNISALAATPTWDTRDNPFFPREGDLARLSLEWGDSAIGSELDFLRSRWALGHFLSLDEDSVVGASWRGGVIAPIHGSETIPIQERFFNGGENTVRSFREDELGPKDSNGKPIGGEAYNVFTLELRERLVGRLELGLFWDVGNVVPQSSDFFRYGDFRQALGAGLRYALPVGPLRLDSGWNPSPREDEDRYVIHFSVGLSF